MFYYLYHSAMGARLFELADLGTLIGASDNVVMAGIAVHYASTAMVAAHCGRQTDRPACGLRRVGLQEKAGHHVSFVEFMKLGFPLMLICVTISTTWLLFLHRFDFRTSSN